MVIKMSGLFCIFFSCCLAGVELERRMKQRWLLLHEMKETLQFLEKEMTWHRTPLPEALKNAARACETSLGSMLFDCAAQAEERVGKSFEQIWRKSIEEKVSSGLLKEAEYQALLDVESALCNSDTVMQKTQLQKQVLRFETLSKNAQEEWREKGKLYRYLSAASGIMAVIILL